MSKLEARIKRAIQLIGNANLKAMAFVPGPNFSYLTGVELHLMERPTLFALGTDGKKIAIMPELERQKWSQAMPDATTFYWKDEIGPTQAFADFASALEYGPLGVEGLRMRTAEYLHLRQHWAETGLSDADAAISALRMCKDEGEISDLRKAISISETALSETLESLKAGETELAIAARLKQAMLSHGASGFSFDPIVLTGPESANPHGGASDRQILPGQVLLIDFGASYGAMHADITRTVFCQYASDEHAAIYETVRKANAAGKEAINVGEPVENVDSAATGVLAASEFSDMILHKTGHGLGRDVHEAPQVMQGVKTPIEPGMVFTVEPGLYRENDIGVRIEDDVLITNNGYESLTTFPRELLTFG